MYVNHIRNTAISGAGAKKRTSGAGGFDTLMRSTGSASAAGGTAAMGQVLAMDALVALQSVDGDGQRKREQVDRSHTLLDELEGLKADLLAGKVDATRLGRIKDLVARHAHVDDPVLADLIAQVDLRAQVEMAKLGH